MSYPTEFRRFEVTAHESSFFSRPRGSDPRLIDPETGKVRADVRSWILNIFYAYCAEIGLMDPQKWANIWVAGSGLTGQWRIQGDLDVLIGIEWPEFFRLNPRYRGNSGSQVAADLNNGMKRSLWPRTAEWYGPNNDWSSPFELTLFINPQSPDIRNLKPYAAYNLVTDSWDVNPIHLPKNWDPCRYFPKDWQDSVSGEIHEAEEIIEDVNRLEAAASLLKGPRRVNVEVMRRLAVQRASRLWHDIHATRSLAFSQFGQGYFDFQTLRWQSHKRAGTADALRQISKLVS